MPQRRNRKKKGSQSNPGPPKVDQIQDVEIIEPVTTVAPPVIETEAKTPDMAPPEKSKDEIIAEREAKKAEKQAAKALAKANKASKAKPTGPSDQAAESKPAPKTDKSREEILAEREAKKAAKQAAKVKSGGNDHAEATTEPKQANSDSGKSKAELKAERRAKQEAQRAAKAAATASADATKADGQGKAGKQPQQRVPDDLQADRPKLVKKQQRRLANAKLPTRTEAQKKVMLFSHLHQYERELSISRTMPILGDPIPACIIQLGLKYSEGTISGSNARCVAFLQVMKKVISDYVTPDNKELSRDLDATIKPYITFLKQCRTLSVSMGNAIRFLKNRINALDMNLSDEEAKEKLCNDIDDFVLENIELAAKQIAITANDKIRDDDVILTYGCSSLMRQVLVHAHKEGKQFRVIVADGRPKFEGREMMRRLVKEGIEVSYVQVSVVPYVLPEVTKVILGAHAVLANGCVMSRVGTSQVALVAKSANIPVLVCCETYKFSDRVQTDSFVFNELGDPDDVVNTGRPNYAPLESWRDLNSLCLLNLTYDVTPASLVDAIISEISVIPTTSVPVVLRLKHVD